MNWWATWSPDVSDYVAFGRSQSLQTLVNERPKRRALLISHQGVINGAQLQQQLRISMISAPPLFFSFPKKRHKGHEWRLQKEINEPLSTRETEIASLIAVISYFLTKKNGCRCVNVLEDMMVHEALCDPANKPATSQTCEVACSGECVLTPWSVWSPCNKVIESFKSS